LVSGAILTWVYVVAEDLALGLPQKDGIVGFSLEALWALPKSFLIWPYGLYVRVGYDMGWMKRPSNWTASVNP